MADFIFERDETVVIVLRVPRRLWVRWEYRHAHYGKAIYALRESIVDIMAHGTLHRHDPNRPDPFYTESEK